MKTLLDFSLLIMRYRTYLAIFLFSGGLINSPSTVLGADQDRLKVSDADDTYYVCPSGCAFNNPAIAVRAAEDKLPYTSRNIKVKIADGVYVLREEIKVNTPLAYRLSVVGNTSDAAKVELVFNNISGTNMNGVGVVRRGVLGFLDGITITGEGAQASHTLEGTTWHHDSYGAGILARSGGYVRLGTHVIVRNFYYSVEADEAGIVDAQDGGVIGRDAGDVNFMARHNGTLICPHCAADRAADTTAPPTLGCNFTAEDGGSLYIDGSTGVNSYTAGLCLLTASHAWAHHLVLKGGLAFKGAGVWSSENSFGELEGSTISNYDNGIYVNNGAGVDASRVRISGSRHDGAVADGGKIVGSEVSSFDNAGFGYHSFHMGSIQLYKSLDKAIRNRLGPVATEQTRTGVSGLIGGSYSVIE